MKHKVLFVNQRYGFQGGAEQNIYSVSSKIKDQFSLSLLYSETTKNEVEKFNEPFKSCNKIPFSEFEKEQLGKVNKVLTKEKPDLIYIHKCDSLPLMKAFINSHIPTLHMIHDHETYCLRGSKTFPVSRKVCTKKAGLCCLFPGLAFLKRNSNGKLSISPVNYSEHKKLTSTDQQCHHFLVPTHYMKDTLSIQGYDPSKISVLFAPPPRVSLDPPILPNFSEANQIIYAGQIIRGKGLDCLIQSLSKIRVPYQLQVLGSGPFESYCKTLAKKLGVEKKINFCGFIPQIDMPNYYKDATMGIVPSVWAEPIATIGLEFMQQGLPVIGFDNGGINEWLKDDSNGYLIPSLNTDLMTEKIEYLLTKKNRARKMGNEARKFIVKHYDFERYIDNLTKLFTKLIN